MGIIYVGSFGTPWMARTDGFITLTFISSMIFVEE